MQDIFGKLNDEQKAAVRHIEGPVLINAGAGSGKTRVLTSRIALLLYNGVPAERILALTFTKKAAKEMKDRIALMVGDSCRGLNMGTFHSVFISFLRPYAESLGYPYGFTIYDEEDSLALLKGCTEEVLFGGEKAKKGDKEESEQRKKMMAHYKPSSVKSRISLAKNNLITAEDYASDPGICAEDTRANRPSLAKIYLLYQQRLKESGVMDFDDILLNMELLLKDNRYALNDFGHRFDYILVDEYQDTNTVQYSILRRLTSWNRNICVVGDDSQSIYAFRGAKIQNILNFTKDYPGCGVYKLETNYRSTRNIVDAANRLIEHNEERIQKDCVSAGEEGSPVHIVPLDTDKEEAVFVAKTIRDGNGSGISFKDFAVLYRTNAQSRALEDILLRYHIPYVIYSGTSFFERMEVRDALAYFKLIVNNKDNEAFKRAVSKPSRGIGDTTIASLTAIAQQCGLSLFETAMLPDLGYRGIKPRTAGALKEFALFIKDLSDRYPSYCADLIAKEAIEQSGLMKMYQEDKSDEGLRRKENLEEVINSVTSFVTDKNEEFVAEGVRDVASLDKYLEDMALLSNVDAAEDDKDKVALMTVHCAKGLEFNTVFVTGLEQGLFPMIRENETKPQDLEEERRLMYVAMTRAEKELYITLAESRLKYGQFSNSEPSQFIDETGLDYEDKDPGKREYGRKPFFLPQMMDFDNW